LQPVWSGQQPLQPVYRPQATPEPEPWPFMGVLQLTRYDI
jgi:hypothetical protein